MNAAHCCCLPFTTTDLTRPHPMNGPEKITDKLSPSDFGELADAAAARRKVKFDPTVNLGHLLTLSACIVAGVSGFTSLEKRITLIEAKANQLEQSNASTEARMRETLTEIRLDVKDARRAIDDVSRTLNSSTYRGNTRRSDSQ